MPNISVEPHKAMEYDFPRQDIYVNQEEPDVHVQPLAAITIQPQAARVEVQPHEPIVIRTSEQQIHVRCE